MVDESDEEDDDEHDVGDDEGVSDVDEEAGYRCFRPERHGGLQTQDKCTDPQGQHPQVADITGPPVETARHSSSRRSAYIFPIVINIPIDVSAHAR